MEKTNKFLSEFKDILPLHLRFLKAAKTGNGSITRTATSSKYGTDKMICSSFYKPISRILFFKDVKNS